MRIFIYIGILFILVSSCQQEKSVKTAVAQVGEKLLFLEEVKNSVPNTLSIEDSTLWANDFIKKWIEKELIILAAEENLTLEQKDVSKELDEYRSSLLTYRYKKELMIQKMDTSITQEEINEYYQKNLNNFILKKNIVKAIYIKAPLEVADPETIKNLSMDNSPEKMGELDEYGISYAKSYDRFNDKWIDVEQILTQFPVEITNQERFLRRNKFVESKDTDYYYFICIRNFRLGGEPAPVEYVETQIKNLLLNQKKINFLKQIEKDIYQEGLASKKFKLFNVQK